MSAEFQNIVDTLKTIVTQHQIQLLTESNKVRSFLADYIPNDAKVLRRISMFYESEASTIVRNNQSNPEFAYRQAVAKYCDYSDASENVGREIVAMFFYALGLEEEIKNAFSLNQPQSNNTATINEYAALIEEGMRNINSSEWQEALHLFEKAIGLNTNSPDGYIGKVLAMSQNGSLDIYSYSNDVYVRCSYALEMMNIITAIHVFKKKNGGALVEYLDTRVEEIDQYLRKFINFIIDNTINDNSFPYCMPIEHAVEIPNRGIHVVGATAGVLSIGRECKLFNGHTGNLVGLGRITGVETYINGKGELATGISSRNKMKCGLLLRLEGANFSCDVLKECILVDARINNIDRLLNSSNASSNNKTTPELSNLYQLARRARDLKNNEDMANYYKQILLQNPNDWEATLYTLYAAYWTSKIASAETMLRNFYNSQELILRLIKENVSDDTEKMNAVAEVGKIAIELSEHFFAISQKYYAQNTVENLNKYVLAVNATVTLGNHIEKEFDVNYVHNTALPCWKQGIRLLVVFINNYGQAEQFRPSVVHYCDVIKRYEPDSKLLEEIGI